jgi:hypothetical protein
MIGTAPDIIPEASSLGAISGSNFGGHAPIVGAHIYVLQAGTSGYGGMATSLITTAGSAQYPVQANTNDPNIPLSQSVTGFPTTWNFVTSDSSGNYNITGDYTCTPGLPVYLYAYGGNATVPPGGTIAGAVAVSAYSVSGTTVTLTVSGLPTGQSALKVGQIVTFSGLGSTAIVGLDTGTYALTGVTATTIQVTLSGVPNGSNGSVSATMTPTVVFNPNIVNLAVLGNCPTSGVKNFGSGSTGALSFVYMNEVSTIAAAYSLSGFFTNSNATLTATDALHLSVPAETGIGSAAWVGLENAALNAAVLYDIQGSVVGTSGDGEAHIANSSVTSSPNSGVVPQALINTLADVLATCVDSNSAVAVTGPPSSSAVTSIQCSTLFGYLGSTVGSGGVPSGTAPTDTATAAIDMAHNPGNSNASTILGLASGVVPFTPTVVPANSTDLMIGITWTIPAAEQSGTLAQGLFNDYVGSSAIDSKGNVWLGSYQGLAGPNQGYLLEYDHLGNQIRAKAVTYNPEVIGLDNSNNLWILPNGYLSVPGTTYGIYDYTAATNYNTVVYNNSAPLDNPESFVIDGNNNVYITAYAGNEAVKISSAGTLLCKYNQNTNAMWGVGLDKSGNPWFAAYGQPLQEWTTGNCNVNGGNARSAVSTGSIASPQVVAFDANGNAWVSDRTQGNAINPKSVNKINSSGTLTSYTGGGIGLQGATALAVDGSGNVIVGTWGSNALTSPNLLTILNNSGQFLTTTNGLTGNYQVTGSGTTTTTTEGFWFFGIDGSGNLWSNGNTNLHEYIGIATPVLTPLAAAVKAGTIASKP